MQKVHTAMSNRARWIILLSLYFTQGLPFGFFTTALPVLMRQDGASLKKIGLSGLLFLPWALKWVWAPWVDRYGSARFGHRRVWIVSLQMATIMVALCLAGVDQSLYWLKIGIVLTAMLAATQDVPTDALALRLLPPDVRGLGNTVQVGGYRLGMVVGGSVLVLLLDSLGWAMAFIAMAGFLALALLPILAFDEPRYFPHRSVSETGSAAADLWQRLRLPGMLPLMLGLMAYKFGDAMASQMVKPYLVDSRWTLPEIALWSATLGSLGGLLGAVLGGIVSDAWGRKRALWVCGLAQTAAVALYAVHAMLWPDNPLMLRAAVLLEHLLGGMATVSLFALMMDASDPDFGATDYALQACAVVVATGVAGGVAGTIADAYGFAWMFGVSSILSLLGCVGLLWGLGRGLAPKSLFSRYR